MSVFSRPCSSLDRRRKVKSLRWWLHPVAATLVLASAVAVSGARAGEPPLDEHALERRLAALEREQHALERSLSEAEREWTELRQRVVARGRAYYRLSRDGPTEDWMEHAVRVERLRRGLLADLQRMRELTERRRAQSAQLELVRERRAPLAAERGNFEQMRQALLSQREREEAFQRAFSETRMAPHTAIYAAGPSVDVADGAGFVQMRGRLPFPLPGRAEIEQVRRRWADGPGLVMRAPMATSVRAVFGGRVAFADEYADYGKTVILDHGEGYYTVSANLGVIEVQVGEQIAAGARLGALGAGAAGRGELYFEVRRGSDTLSPAEWFGI